MPDKNDKPDSKTDPKPDSMDRLLERLLRSTDLSEAERDELVRRIDAPLSVPKAKEFTQSRSYIRVGVVGDAHLNSKDCNLKALRAFYKYFKQNNAHAVIQTGDLTEGEEMRKDQKFGLQYQGIDEVVNHVVNNYPNEGIPTYFIGGNHDESYLKHAGHDICANIASKRKDMIYLGMNEGDLPNDFSPVKIKVWHPSNGTAGAKSYQIQKLIEAFVNQDEQKPHVLIVGHYHKHDALFHQNVHAYQAGTVQNQTGWMRTKNLAAEIKAWMLDIYYNASGEVEQVVERVVSWEDLKHDKK